MRDLILKKIMGGIQLVWRFFPLSRFTKDRIRDGFAVGMPQFFSRYRDSVVSVPGIDYFEHYVGGLKSGLEPLWINNSSSNIVFGAKESMTDTLIVWLDIHMFDEASHLDSSRYLAEFWEKISSFTENGLNKFCFCLLDLENGKFIHTLNEYLCRSPKPRFDFCFALSNGVQTFDAANTSLDITKSLLRSCFENERYIRVDGKPLLIISHDVDKASVSDLIFRWRSWCVQTELSDLYMLGMQSASPLDTE